MPADRGESNGRAGSRGSVLAIEVSSRMRYASSTGRLSQPRVSMPPVSFAPS
jgi:hypothetical protein